MGYLPHAKESLFCAGHGGLRFNDFHWHRTFSGIPTFALVLVELLLKARLGFFNSGKCPHGSFELLAARCADRDARYLPQALYDPKSTFDHETACHSPLFHRYSCLSTYLSLPSTSASTLPRNR
jgi:hypothetical protein